MVVGDNSLFPYRSSSRISQDFARCITLFHDGSTRKWWAKERLGLNMGVCHTQDLPSNDLLQVISELFDTEDFDGADKKVEPALAGLKQAFSRHGLVAYLDEAGRRYVRDTKTGVNSSTLPPQSRPLSPEEIAQRQKLVEFLNSASEDEFYRAIVGAFVSAPWLSPCKPGRALGKDPGVWKRPLDEIPASHRPLGLFLRSNQAGKDRCEWDWRWE